MIFQGLALAVGIVVISLVLRRPQQSEVNPSLKRLALIVWSLGLVLMGVHLTRGPWGLDTSQMLARLGASLLLILSYSLPHFILWKFGTMRRTNRLLKFLESLIFFVVAATMLALPIFGLLETKEPLIALIYLTGPLFVLPVAGMLIILNFFEGRSSS